MNWSIIELKTSWKVWFCKVIRKNTSCSTPFFYFVYFWQMIFFLGLNSNTKSYHFIISKLLCWLVGFYHISTLKVYLISNPLPKLLGIYFSLPQDLYHHGQYSFLLFWYPHYCIFKLLWWLLLFSRWAHIISQVVQIYPHPLWNILTSKSGFIFFLCMQKTRKFLWESFFNHFNYHD